MKQNEKQTILRIEGVSKIFNTSMNQVKALENINCVINNGDFITLLGPSGCGKSTLLRIIGGLEESSEGAVYLYDEKIFKPGRERGMVFQTYTLFPWLTVEENITFGLKLNHESKSQKKEIAEYYMNLIGLSEFKNHYPIQLSGGMKQRVAIARALAYDPKILLMDEPFGALDAQTRLLMQEMLLKIWEGTKKTIIFVTHDVEEAVFLADKVFVMSARPGKLKRIEVVNFERPRKYELKHSDSFRDVVMSLTDEIRKESFKTF